MKAIFAGQNAPRTLSPRAGLLHGVASSFTSVLDHERADSSFGTIPDMSFPLIPLPGMLPDHKKDMGSHMAGSWIAHRLMGQDQGPTSYTELTGGKLIRNRQRAVELPPLQVEK
ncbi:hypothetical protein AAC387_Pa02g3062 [Persea americana]